MKTNFSANILFVILISSCTLLACTDDRKNTQKIELGDITQFGTSLLGKNVEFEGVIGRAYACQLPENRGNQCLEVYKQDNQKIGEAVIIKDGIYSPEQYKNWMNAKKLVRLGGKVGNPPSG